MECPEWGEGREDERDLYTHLPLSMDTQLRFCPLGGGIRVQFGSHSQSDSSLQNKSLKSLLSVQQKVHRMGRRSRVLLR